MLAQVVRQSRFGDPRESFQVEEIDTPSPGPGQVLIAVMAAGVNFNNVWAARGQPVDVIAQRQRAGGKEDFHVGGSDASGIVYEVGGRGGQAIRLARIGGGVPVAVVSSPERGEYCVKLGAAGWINRRDYKHWGVPPHWDDASGQKEWVSEARRFGKALWDVLGERRNPAIVFEHPGEATVPTSMFVCEEGGMVVICAGTSGYSAMVDDRYLWTRQKRFQGSHGSNDQQAAAFNDLVRAKKIDPCLGRVIKFEELPVAHFEMGEGEAPPGNTVALVGARKAGEGAGKQ